MARQLCDNNLVEVNGNKARASKIVAIGDVVGVSLRGKKIVFKVIELPAGNVSKEKAFEMYELISQESVPMDNDMPDCQCDPDY